MDRRIFSCAVLMLLVSAVSCSQKYELPEEPEVDNPSTTVLQAAISDYEGVHAWSRGDAVGVYGSEAGENVRYVISSAYFGKTGPARLYGAGAAGTLTAYFPYAEDGCAAAARGRQPLPAVQKYCTDAVSQIKENSVLVAVAQEGLLSFSYVTGALQIRLAVDIAGTVQSVRLVSAAGSLCGDLSLDGAEPLLENAGAEIALEGIGKPCQPGTPLTVCFMLPPGTYGDLSVTLVSDEETVTKPVDAAVPISACTVSSCTVNEKETVYEGSDLVIIDTEFDD